MKVTPRSGQDVFDISIQLFGRIDDVFDILATTGDIDPDLTPGAEIKFSTDSAGDVVTLFRLQQLAATPNNADELAEIDTSGGGSFVPFRYSVNTPAARERVTTRSGQDVFDMSIQLFGDIESIFNIVDIFGDIDSDLTPGAAITINTDNIADEKTVRRLIELNLYPNNADGFVIEPELIGVGYWIIENTFVVS